MASRSGVRYTKEEEDQILQELRDGKELIEIAGIHSRTVRGITIRVHLIAFALMDKNELTVNQISDLVKIPVEVLLYLKSEHDMQTRTKPSSAGLVASLDIEKNPLFDERFNKIEQELKEIRSSAVEERINKIEQELKELRDFLTLYIKYSRPTSVGVLPRINSDISL